MAITPEQQEKMKAAKAAKAAEAPKESGFVTKEEFSALNDKIGNLVEMLSAKQSVSTPEEKESLKEVNEAKPNQSPVSPVWEEKAFEILGKALDHCEVFYPKEGGTHFTVVIKREFSNAPKDYWIRMKTDRRTREVSREGLEGVIKWCTLINQNLMKK
jgi:hypothetical protein